ncbi:hypothetical protein AAG570_014054 [Ranatra chinensis]|uniref:2-C-methyl-D-erythritol 4-phosphate cytidylyltransferase, chloroplastic n=1 Tax=Ranatra chinensis TaxID=642074 RepID=A0ABD0XS94_9HEMI
MHCWAILLAAGKGNRCRTKDQQTAKQFLSFFSAGYPLYWHSALTFSRIPAIQGICFVFPPQENDSDESSTDYAAAIQELERVHPLRIPQRIARGGKERQDSVYSGLLALPDACTHVLVHDTARPFVSAELVTRIIDALRTGTNAVVPGVPVNDTVKQITPDGTVGQTLERSCLRAIQTPQGFSRPILEQAHAKAAADGYLGTDDASLAEHAGFTVNLVEGETANVKITTPEDLALLQPQQQYRQVSGLGYDVHRYGGTRAFVLGGVPIPTPITVDAHSDGDTLLHALIDGILGCLGLGDIGTLFPDSDARFENIPSSILLAEVLTIAEQRQLAISHVDITLVAQTPKIGPHREAIAKNVARMLHLPFDHVNVKATTEEKLGFTGEKKGIKVMALVSASLPL